MCICSESLQHFRFRICLWHIRNGLIKIILLRIFLLDNLLRVDMYTRAEKLHIETDVKTCCIYY